VRSGAARHARRTMSTPVVRVPGPIEPGDVGVLCARVTALLRRLGAGPVVCDVTALEHPDAAAVDALCRVQLAARRCGGRVRLRGMGDDLRDLLAFAGLSEVFGCDEASVEAGRQPEEREPARRVQEEADPGDPAP
jgi:anti-anti-sigma regulatory factor